MALLGGRRRTTKAEVDAVVSDEAIGKTHVLVLDAAVVDEDRNTDCGMTSRSQ